MRQLAKLKNDYLWSLIYKKRAFVKPKQHKMGILDLNNIVIPSCLDYLPMTRAIKQINSRYPIIEQYHDILNKKKRPLYSLLGSAHYTNFGDFTQYFMFIGLYYRYKIVIDRDTLVEQVTSLSEIKINDILFIPNYLDILRFKHSTYKYLFLFESLIDDYRIFNLK